MNKTLFYTFLQTKHQEENTYSTDVNRELLPREVEIRPITPCPWDILKTLTIDELWFGGKFQFPLEQIQDTILRDFPQHVISLTYQRIASIKIFVNDLDTNTFHGVTLWKYPHENSYAMRDSWIEEFVKRRRLVAGTVVGMYWDFKAYILRFSVLEGNALS